MTRAHDEADEDEIHPQYDMAAQLEELFSVPVYRQPELPIIESWREIGERLLALGDRHLNEGIEAAREFLEAKLEARRRRREQRAARRRAAKAAREAKAAEAKAAEAKAAEAKAAEAKAAEAIKSSC